MLKAVFATTFLFALSPFAVAQVIFEPVQYQYGSDPTLYYGGSNPRVFEKAEEQRCPVGLYKGRFYGSEGEPSPFTRIERVGYGPLVYTDCFPYRNAYHYGYTADDAANEANRNAPTHFRMGDLLNAAVPAGDGTLIVPAQARPVRSDATRPARSKIKPRAIIILPKKPKAPTAPAAPEKSVAVAK